MRLQEMRTSSVSMVWCGAGVPAHPGPSGEPATQASGAQSDPQAPGGVGVRMLER